MKFVSKTGFGLLSLTAPLVLLCGCDRANHYEKGMEWVAKKDYSDALVEMRKAMAKDQGTADTYYQAGVAAMELSANADAKRYLDAADNLAGPRSKLDLDIKARLAIEIKFGSRTRQIVGGVEVAFGVGVRAQ